MKEIELSLNSGQKVNKVTVARQQLDAAIELFFKAQDYIPIHTLVCAASEVLESLCLAKGIATASHTIFANYLSDGVLSPEVKRMTRKHSSFFKHADRDPDEIIQLPDPRLLEALIYQGGEDYSNLGFEKTDAMSTYYIWFLIKNPESLDDKTHNAYSNTSQINMAVKHFSESDLLRFGLLMLYVRQQKIEEAAALINELKQSTKTDAMAIITRMHC